MHIASIQPAIQTILNVWIAPPARISFPSVVTLALDAPRMDRPMPRPLPFGRHPQMLQPLQDRPRREYVTPHVDEFVQVQHQEVVRTNLLRDPVVDRLRSKTISTPP